ncbi:glycosyltransferase [Patescibacteria group bacterium]
MSTNLHLKPKVSVIMPVFNNGSFVKESIQSVLEQSFKEFEFLIIDDCSTDNSLKVISKFKDKRIKIFKNKKRKGLAWCLNYLQKQSKSEYIARMDGDDVSYKERLKEQFNFLKLNPEYVLVGGWAKIINNKGNIIGEMTPPIKYLDVRKTILSNNTFVHPAVMFKKSIVQKVGGYNEKLFYSQDYDIFLRLVSKYPCANLKNYLVKFRWNPDFKKQKQQHKTALEIRIKAIRYYGYSKIGYVKLLKPFVYYSIPIFIKKIYWNNKFKN